MRDTNLKFRCTRAEREQFEKARNDAGFPSLTGWLRAIAYERMACENPESLSKELHNMRLELARIGNNLNQIAKRINSGESADVTECLYDVRQIIKQASASIGAVTPSKYMKK